MLYDSFSHFSTQVRVKLQKKKFESCLLLIQRFVEDMINIDILDGLLLDIPGLDDICLEIGQKIFFNSNFNLKMSNPSKSIIYIATQLYRTGGHTAIIEDFIQSQPHKQHIILLTDIFNTGKTLDIIERFKYLPVKLIFSPLKISLTKKLIWLQQTWFKINPEKVFLFNHHQDVVAIAAAHPNMPGQLFYYHHTDFQLGLGLRLNHAKHIDIHSLTYTHCRHTLAINNVYCPLTCHDINLKNFASKTFMRDNKINTASSGACKKFIQNYLYSYIDLLPEIMKITKGKHIHIGYLPSKILNSIHEKLILANISQEKFIYIPWVKNIGLTMIEQQIDLYITSFPVGGGRTAIEVMASATPIAGHLNYRSSFLSENHLLYPKAFLWKTPDELKTILNMLSPEILTSHAAASREHYLSHHSNKLLLTSIMSDFQALIPPKISINENKWYTFLFLDIAIEIQKLKHVNITSLLYQKIHSKIKKILKQCFRILSLKFG